MWDWVHDWRNIPVTLITQQQNSFPENKDAPLRNQLFKARLLRVRLS